MTIRIGPLFFPVLRALVTTDYKFFEFALGGSKILTKSENYQFLRDWLGNGLLISDGRFSILGTKRIVWKILGDYWKRHRKILTRAFHTEVLKDFVSVFESVGDVLIKKLEKYDGKPSVDVHRLITLCTLDIICGKYIYINCFILV